MSASVPICQTECNVIDAGVQILRSNLSTAIATSSLWPNTSSASTPRNRSLLENLLTVRMDHVDAIPEKPKKMKFYFRELVSNFQILNEKHQYILTTSTELQDLEICLNPSQLEGYKKLILVHNFCKQCAEFEIPRVLQFSDYNKLGIVCRFLKTIAYENKIAVEE